MSEKCVLPAFPHVKCDNGEFWLRALSTARVFLKIRLHSPGLFKSKCSVTVFDLYELSEKVSRE